jgi:hypothetical protein
VAGCQGAQSGARCAKTQSAGGISGQTLLSGGGVLTLEGVSIAPGSAEQKNSAQCSAFVQVSSKNNTEFKGKIWTARHCLPDYISRITSIDLRIFDGRGGYIPIQTKLPLAEAREGFFKLVSEKIPEFSDAQKKTRSPARIALDYSFLEEEGKKNYGSECKDPSSSAPIKDSTLCSALQDLRILDANFSAQEKTGNDVLNAILARESSASQANQSESIVNQWRVAVMKQQQLELDISRGRFVDIYLQCAESTPSAVCAYKDTLETLARKWRAPGRDLLAEASQDGFTLPGKSYAEFRKSTAQDYYNKTLLPLFTKIQTRILSQSNGLIFAGNFSDPKGKFRIFSSAPLKDFYTPQEPALQFSFMTRPESRDAFVRFESPVGKTLVLEKGDSGSVLLLDDRTPFMVITAKGANSISGGASILSLPVPSDEDSTASKSSPNVCKN